MAVTSLRILVDNRSAAPGLGFEHGWSVWLDLGGAGEAALAETARALREFGVRRVFAGHCTGETAAAYLRDHAAGETTPTGSGLVIRP